MKKIKFIIDGKEFPAVLNDSEAAKQLYYLLPITVPFTQKGGYEYYCALEDTFDTAPVLLDFAEKGSIMLYLSNYVAVFYNDLEPILEYTPLGKLDKTDGLKEAFEAGFEAVQIVRVED